MRYKEACSGIQVTRFQVPSRALFLSLSLFLSCWVMQFSSADFSLLLCKIMRPMQVVSKLSSGMNLYS